MDVLQAKIGGNQKLGSWRDAQDSAIISNTLHHRPVPGSVAELPNIPDQVSLFAHWSYLTYIKTRHLYRMIAPGQSRTLIPR